MVSLRLPKLKTKNKATLFWTTYLGLTGSQVDLNLWLSRVELLFPLFVLWFRLIQTSGWPNIIWFLLTNYYLRFKTQLWSWLASKPKSLGFFIYVLSWVDRVTSGNESLTMSDWINLSFIFLKFRLVQTSVDWVLSNVY